MSIGTPKGLSRLALALSHTLSPAGVAVILMAILALRGANGGGLTPSMALGGSFAFAMFPALVLLVMARVSGTSDVYDPVPTVRRRMLLAGTSCYIMSYVIFHIAGENPVMGWVGATFIAGAAVVWSIDRFWKISIHNTGAGGGAVLLAEVAPELWLLWIMLPIVVGWARWHRGAHDLPQLAAGAAVGGILAQMLKGSYL